MLAPPLVARDRERSNQSRVRRAFGQDVALALRFNPGRLAQAAARMSTKPMRIIVVLGAALLVVGCEGDLGSEPSAIQEQQTQRSFYGPGNPGLTNPPPNSSGPKPEPVPGEVVPDR